MSEQSNERSGSEDTGRGAAEESTGAPATPEEHNAPASPSSGAGGEERWADGYAEEEVEVDDN